jgi:hypothetical protein
MSCVAADDDVLLPARVVGPSLAAAGLAAWLLVQAGREQDAEQCGEIQELMDTALRQGRTDVSVPRPVVVRAAELWEATAALADTWASTSDRPEQAADCRLHAERLRIRAASLRQLLGSGGA